MEVELRRIFTAPMSPWSRMVAMRMVSHHLTLRVPRGLRESRGRLLREAWQAADGPPLGSTPHDDHKFFDDVREPKKARAPRRFNESPTERGALDVCHGVCVAPRNRVAHTLAHTATPSAHPAFAAASILAASRRSAASLLTLTLCAASSRSLAFFFFSSAARSRSSSLSQ